MISLFLGLSWANVILMATALVLGLLATGADTDAYALHATIGIASGLMTTLTHMVIYAYFMATHKWLQAATEKGDLDPLQFVRPALTHKYRALGTAMAAVTLAVLTLFAGAATDPTTAPWLPPGAHLATAVTAIIVNLIAAGIQFPLVRQQNHLVDRATALLNDQSNTQH